MLLGQIKGNIPLVVLRPTIVTSTYKEPFPGWVEGIRTIDSLAVGYGKGRLTCFLGDPESIIDLVGSSLTNPLRYSWIQDYGQRYFTKHPWVGKDGKAVIVGKVTVLSSMASFRRYMVIRYLLPLKGLQVANTVFCQFFQGTYSEFRRKINFVFRLVELYQPYLFFKGVYDDINTEKLRMAAKEGNVETDVFYFDPKTINWEDYFMNTHLSGVVKYVFR
ncbi:hypothetical protein RHGRI_002196 [Rhododendron griersonianum]|uniref:Fatty acyl-CoA reductase n=1 Tax=Rhododendron griersonianum TaxID=479676 RepID=A0AAV6LNK7_9ERIC|nr:hypothetical protein RHGRI_002196 [Rhododendron griersonianum]